MDIKEKISSGAREIIKKEIEIAQGNEVFFKRNPR